METRYRKITYSRFSKNFVVSASLLVAVLSLFLFAFLLQESPNGLLTVDSENNYETYFQGRTNGISKESHSKTKNNNNNVHIAKLKSVPVFYPVYYSDESKRGGGTVVNNPSAVSFVEETAVSSIMSKLLQDLKNSPLVDEIIALDAENLTDFVKACGDGTLDFSDGSNTVTQRIEMFKRSKQPHLAVELLKYCAMKHYKGGLFLDSQSTLSSTIEHLLFENIDSTGNGMTRNGNLAVLNDPMISPNSIHGAMLYVADYSNSDSNQGQSTVLEGMIKTLLSTNIKILESSPLFLAKTLHELIANDMKVAKLIPGMNSSENPSSNHWYLLQHTCSHSPLGQRQVTAQISSYAFNSHRCVFFFILPHFIARTQILERGIHV